jgi:hypothetical protein
MIRSNKAACLKCAEVVESKFPHHFVTCACGNLSVDGGLIYLKRLFNPGEDDGPTFDELSDADPEHFA